LSGSHSAGENALDSRLRGNDGVKAGGKLAIPHFTLFFGCNTQQLLNTKQTIMTTWFISRHPGALEWMRRNGVPFDRHLSHLNMAEVRAGDTVIGSLPVNIAAEVCASGARYKHLALKLAAADRGRELSAQELEDYEACLETYLVEKKS
jgi:CRISPR-associated protein Csx16